MPLPLLVDVVFALCARRHCCCCHRQRHHHHCHCRRVADVAVVVAAVTIPMVAP